MKQSLVQTKAYQTLAACLRGGRLPHAVLIDGGCEEDRAELALLAAKGAVCEGDSGEGRPCGVCRHCIKAEKEIHPDILRYGSEGGARSFHIDAVRQIRQQAFVRPNEADGKSFVLEQVQDMSVQAQNALLKIIEEPPPGVTFVLTCPNQSAMLETIRSRATILSLPAGQPQRQEGDEEAAQAEEQAAQVLRSIVDRRELDALETLSHYERNRPGLVRLLESMRQLLGELLAGRGGGQAGEGETDLGMRLSRLQILSIVDIIDETAAALRDNANAALLGTAFCARVKGSLE